MRSFLLKGKRPIIKWGMLPEGVFFEGNVPEGYQLAVCPSGNYIVVDIDKHGDKNGFKNIPKDIFEELLSTYFYKTKNEGMHYWLEYTGNLPLANKSSKYSIDLRTNKGYVVWYPKTDVRDVLDKIKPTSEKMNKWLERLFSYGK